MILKPLEVKAICYNAGFRGIALDYAVKIAGCESGFNARAHNTNGEDSRGLFQINVAPGANPQYSKYDLFDPQTNANIAYEIFKKNNNSFVRWTCAKKLNLVYPDKVINTIAFFVLSVLVFFLYK